MHSNEWLIDAKVVYAAFFNNPNAEVMQYTGLKDKNGKEIFEGDVIACHDSRGDLIKHRISFEESEARFIVTCTDFNNISGGVDQKWIDEFKKEVIGNIHENPELV